MCAQAEYSLDDIKFLFGNPLFLFAESVVLISIAIVLLHVRLPKEPKEEAGMEETQNIAFCHAYLAGAFAGQQNCCFKCLGELLKNTIEHGDASAWSDWLVYAVLFWLCFFSYYQLSHLNRGLRIIAAVKFLPVDRPLISLSPRLSSASL